MHFSSLIKQDLEIWCNLILKKIDTNTILFLFSIIFCAVIINLHIHLTVCCCRWITAIKANGALINFLLNCNSCNTSTLRSLFRKRALSVETGSERVTHAWKWVFINQFDFISVVICFRANYHWVCSTKSTTSRLVTGILLCLKCFWNCSILLKSGFTPTFTIN